MYRWYPLERIRQRRNLYVTASHRPTSGTLLGRTAPDRQTRTSFYQRGGSTIYQRRTTPESVSLYRVSIFPGGAPRLHQGRTSGLAADYGRQRLWNGRRKDCLSPRPQTGTGSGRPPLL